VFFGALQSAVLFLPIVTDLPRPALELLQGVVAMLITVQLARLVTNRLGARPSQPRGSPAAAVER
jgi:hypothetical protein